MLDMKKLEALFKEGWVLEHLSYDEQQGKYAAEVSEPEGNTFLIYGKTAMGAVSEAVTKLGGKAK